MEFPMNFFAAGTAMNTYEKHVPAPYIRKSFTPGEFTKAVLRVTGLGFYELFLNGEKLTKGLLAPYISNPDDLVYFDEYDMTEKLDRGRNAVGLILGNGMQNAPGGRVWDFDIARFRGVPRFAMSLTLTDENGKETVLEADESFRTHPSHILFDDLRSGVFADASLEIKDWCSPDFDDTSWAHVIKTESPRGEKRVCEAEPVLVTKEVSPVSVTTAYVDPVFNNRDNMKLDTEFRFDFKDRPGTLYDFGVNTAGVVKLKIRGEKGQKIFVQMCEYVNSEGKASYSNINFYPDGYAQVLHFTCSGNEDEFIPPFTYYGFRYALVYGLTEAQKTPQTLTMLAANSALKRRADFTCSDETLNKLFEMSVRSDLANFFYFPTDCPHREKNGWTGDAATSAEHLLLVHTPENSMREWLRNICAAQGKQGNLPGIVPTGGWGLEWGNGPAWDNVLTELCWQIYRLRGDLTPARECSENIFRYLSYIAQQRRPDGLIAIGLGDWLQPSRGSGAPTAPLYLTDSVMCVYICAKAADLFTALDLPLHAEFAKKLREEFRQAIRDRLIDHATATVRSRCQTAQAICIYYGIFNDDEKARACEVLVKLIEEKDEHLDCGMIGLRVIFHVLSDCGRSDLAYKMITRDDYPSYGQFIKRGLTALPEDFTPEETWDEPSSLNHHFFGDISGWMIRHVAGIDPAGKAGEPERINITPGLFDTLSFAKASYDAPCGKVTCAWKKTADGVTLTLDCPEAMNGLILLPAGWVFSDEKNAYGRLHGSSVTETVSGTYLLKKAYK